MGKKIITVFGATGMQGGSVALTFLTDPKLKSEWSVRAITRDTKKPASKNLAKLGAELVTADLNDKYELTDAMEGSAAVYAMTNYWEKLNMQLEIKQGKNLVEAAKAAKVEHFIFSSLLNITKLTDGRLSSVYHFDGKALIEDYARKSGIPATFFLPGTYMSNFPGTILRPSPPDNNWILSLPVSEEAIIPMFAVSDTGKYIKAIVRNRDKLLGKRVFGATAYMTTGEILEGFKKLFPGVGEKAGYFNVPQEQYKSALKGMGFPEFAAQELLENMLLFEGPGYYGGESLDESHSILEDKLMTWEEHLKLNPASKDLK